MANPRFAWGIDVGNRALKAVKLVRDGAGGLRIDDVDVIEHEHILSDAGDNKETLIAHALQAFAAKHPEKGGAVAVGVSGQSSFARFIKLPPVEDKKLPEIVRFEAIQQIPFPLDDVEWSYQLFQDEGSPEKEVGIFAMRKELVNEHIKNFTDAGLNVQLVQMNPLAVYNAMHFDQRVKGTTMIVDVGAENTDLIIAEGEQVWLRSIPVGGNNFSEALVKQFKLKFPKAEELKRNAATSKYTRQILQAMRPVFDNLVAEIQRSIGFYASVHREARISRVVALGGTFRLPGLMKFLQMQLQLDVQRFDALGASPPADARVATVLNDNVLSTVSAYGLALQAMGEGKITSSLLPLAIRRERMWRDKTKWFAAAAALFCVGTGVAVGRYYYDNLQYESAADERRDIAAELVPAQKYDTEWKEVEASGDPERKQIASLQSLTKLRELQAKLMTTIEKALPEPTPKPEGKRGERAVLLIDEIVPGYYADLTPAIEKNERDEFKMSQPDFVQNADAQGASPGVRRGMGGSQSMALTLKTSRYGGAGPRDMMGMGGGDASESGTLAKTQRGYLFTMTCLTPMARWQNLAESVRTELIGMTKPEGKEKQEFRIERVEIVSGRKIDPQEMLPAVRARTATVARPSNRPIRPGSRGGLYGGGASRMPFPDAMEEGGYSPFGGRTSAARSSRLRSGTTARGTQPRRLGSRNAPEETAPAEEELIYPMPALNFDAFAQDYRHDPNQPAEILDPLTGEDASKDYRLTFLIAVVLDPPLPAPPAEPGETPAQEVVDPADEAVRASDEDASGSSAHRVALDASAGNAR